MLGRKKELIIKDDGATEVKGFSVTQSMSKKEIEARVNAAKVYFSSAELSPAKKRIVNLCIAYAEKKLCSIWNKATNRYAIYSNIINQAERLDDLHFMHYAMRQISRISPDDNSSFRDEALYTVMAYRKVLVAPMVASMQKAFMGLTVMGMGMLLSDHIGKASTLMLMGAFGYIASPQIVDARLDRSLEMKFNRVLTAGVEQTYRLEDGLNDEIGSFQATASRMLGSGLTLFEGAGRQFDRVARLAGGQPQPVLQAANPVNQGNEEQQERVQLLK